MKHITYQPLPLMIGFVPYHSSHGTPADVHKIMALALRVRRRYNPTQIQRGCYRRYGLPRLEGVIIGAIGDGPP